MVAKDVKYLINLQKIFQSTIAYQCFKSIHTSSDYFENMRKDIFAMICQLGPPTFFVTFTSVEHLWDPLTNALKKQNSGNPVTCLNNGSNECIDTLIRSHPVTCS